MVLISSRRNPIVKKLRSLSTKKGREDTSSLLLEGTHLLQEAFSLKYRILEIIATTNWLTKNANLIDSISKEIIIYEVSDSVLKASLTTISPDGVASVVSFESLPSLKERANFVLALDRLQDPGNLGTLFRTALASGVEEIWLALGADPLGQKVLRASAGAVLHLPYQRFSSEGTKAIECFAKRLQSSAHDGYQVIGTHTPQDCMHSSIIPYWEMDWTKPTVLVLGNEGSGLNPTIDASCTHRVTLPHSPAVESLNVAAAAVPLLLERQRAKMISAQFSNGE